MFSVYTILFIYFSLCSHKSQVTGHTLHYVNVYMFLQEIVGTELVEVLQIKNKIPRRKALALLESKVKSILSEKGYVSKMEEFVSNELIPDLLEDEDEDEEVVVDGEVDEGDVHIKPVGRKSIPLVVPRIFGS